MKGWLTPLAAAACVVAMVLGVHYAVTGGGADAGPGPDRPRVAVTDPAMPEPRDLTPREATINGYRTDGSRLTLFYELGDIDCGVGFRVQAVASEAVDSVSVRLQQVLTGRSARACPGQEGARRVSIALGRPLTYQVVRDATTGTTLPQRD